MSKDTLTVAEAAERLGCSPPTLRRAIEREDAANKPDSLRFCPGGRKQETKYIVLRGVFEAVVEGRAIDANLRGPIPFDAGTADEAA